VVHLDARVPDVDAVVDVLGEQFRRREQRRVQQGSLSVVVGQ
jgi:hypothetical protein